MNSLLSLIFAVFIISTASAALSFCPPNKPQVYCLVDPCMFAKCPAFPYASCRSNYCGGCNADWYQNGNKVNCSVPSTPSKSVSNIQPVFPCTLVQCFIAPCSVSKCSKYPEAVCRDNYCNGCKADWFLNNIKVYC